MNAPSTAKLPPAVDSAPTMPESLDRTARLSPVNALAPADPREVRDWLERQLEDWAGEPRTLLASIPAPVVEPSPEVPHQRRSGRR